MSARTLRHWRWLALYPASGTPGRPGWSLWAWRTAARAVRSKISDLGHVGWRTLHAALGGQLSRYVVQQVLRLIKARHRRRVDRHRRAVARHVEVHGSMAVWSMDGTHLGRTRDRCAVAAQVLKDNGSRAVLRSDVGRAATGDDVVALLQAARHADGDLPLAVITDNGPEYKSDELGRFLEAEQVLHIRNLPHTPQHNGAGERANGELKADAGLGKGVVIRSLGTAARVIEASRRRLNRRPRAVLGGRTANEQHWMAAARYTAATRESLYAAGCRAMQDAMQRPGTVRARRLAARRAALDTLEQYGIITQSRGCGR